MSGKPLFELSTRILAETARRVEGRFPLVGVGGIDSPDTARLKLEAGATLVQLYSALVFEGIGLVGRIKRESGPAVEFKLTVGRTSAAARSQHGTTSSAPAIT